jgi:MoxR-like ATPase
MGRRRLGRCRLARLGLERLVRIGASPRATINLTLAARACALLEGRDHVTPDDIKLIAPDVLRHRLVLSYEALAEGESADAIVRRIMQQVAQPARPLQSHVDLEPRA